ncbi:FAD-binding oxidoreductase [Cyanobium sp. HWJ4-Hawea]|uniref:FAD-binding oxidoreductase n=1 Tax=Cyanobium sp. HWJ4-Hawea TaxID=2823713 RepID=UPI0020CE89C8|nr:FAD-binding oxidoreductase [Cyanobium sp. HWJ4-Hawea]
MKSNQVPDLAQVSKALQAQAVKALVDELRLLDPGLVLTQEPGELEKLSRDFYDFSPVLIPQLQEHRAQLAVFASKVEQVQLVAGACARHGLPLTVRGAGTGNYGQCVPLEGGVVLEMRGLNRVRQIDPETGVVEVEAGCSLAALDQQLAAAGRALRMVPSTMRTATVGGYFAGGSSGLGSLRWGFLRDPGNLLGLEVVTLEAEPRLLQLDAEASVPLNHAYGTNGILTALRLPSTEAVAWQQVVVGFQDWQQALAAAQLLPQTAFFLQGLTLLEAEVAAAMPWPPGCPKCPSEQAAGPEHRLLLWVGPDALRSPGEGVPGEGAPAEGALVAWLGARGGEVRWLAPNLPGPGLPLREFTWNHTTLHWRSNHPDWTYLQMLLPQPETPCLAALRQRWGADLLWHLEAVKHEGAARLAALPLLRWQGQAQLAELIQHCRELGAFVFNPHVLTVEDGGLGVIDADQVAAKAAHDPAGLLNPGKLRGWLSR